MIINAETTVTASTTAVALHTPNVVAQHVLVKNTSANGATLTATGQLTGQASTTVQDISLAAGASATISLDYGETLTGKRSGGSDATLSVLRWYPRN